MSETNAKHGTESANEVTNTATQKHALSLHTRTHQHPPPDTQPITSIPPSHANHVLVVVWLTLVAVLVLVERLC